MIAASNLQTGALLIPLLWVFGVATILVALFHTRKLPSLLGFLLTGVVVGPAGFGVVQDAEAIAIMAEIGVVLLMFTIGLEVSLKDLLRIGRLVTIGGLTQIVLTTFLFAGIGYAIGLQSSSAWAIGLLASASSTALVLRMLGDRGELSFPHGQLALGILLAQDFAVVALMLVLPMLADGGISASKIAYGLGEAILLATAIVFFARLVFPKILTKVVELRSREVFMLTTFATVFGTALVAEVLGLSLALGAFLAGLVVSESDFSHQMFAEVLPFRDIFNGLFFASVGLLIDPDAVAENWVLLAAFVATIIVGKGAIVAISAKLVGLDNRTAWLGAVSLSQVGEFGLVLAQLAAGLALITSTEHSLIIAAAVITMAITSLALPWFSNRTVQKEAPPLEEHDFELNDHVIIVGYGLNGRNVARVLKRLNVAFVVVEMNQGTVTEERESGVPILYGDATRPALLEHLHVRSARALVCAIAGAAATREIVSSAHHANPDMLVITRTRYINEIDPLLKLGADVVVPEEFETSIELAAQVMHSYGASNFAIQRERRALREERYQVMRDGDFKGDHSPLDELMSALDIDCVEVPIESAIAGRSLKDLDFRAKTGANILAVRRTEELHVSPAGDFVLESGDELTVTGDPESMISARELLKPRELN